MDKKKNATESKKKCLENNYHKLGVNVRKEKYEVWKQYAESKGLSMYALVNQLFDEAIEKDGFVPSEKSE